MLRRFIMSCKGGQAEAARRLGCSGAAISLVLSGRRSGIGMADALGREFHIHPDACVELPPPEGWPPAVKNLADQKAVESGRSKAQAEAPAETIGDGYVAVAAIKRAAPVHGKPKVQADLTQLAEVDISQLPIPMRTGVDRLDRLAEMLLEIDERFTARALAEPDTASAKRCLDVSNMAFAHAILLREKFGSEAASDHVLEVAGYSGPSEIDVEVKVLP